MFDNIRDHLIVLAYCMFAACAGLIGYIMRTMDNDLEVQWGKGLINFFASGFVGSLVLLLCRAIGVSGDWTGVIVGVFGWLGANVTIQMLEDMVRKRLGLDKRVDPTDEDHPL